MRNTIAAIKYFAGLLGLFSSSLACAHVSSEHAQGFISGLAHSFSGLDHLLAMFAVGVLASQRRAAVSGRNDFWLLPLLFVLSMAGGAALPLWSVGAGLSTLVESGIIASLIALGALVAMPRSAPLLLSISLTLLFGFCHGFAHGSEIPANTQGELFLLGAVCASGIVHATGLLIAPQLRDIQVRIAGGVISLVGLVLALG